MTAKTSTKWIVATGRRKESVARVYMNPKGSGKILVNGKDYKEYFPSVLFQQPVEQPLKLVDMWGKVDLRIRVEGGGLRGQSEAIRHGIARALIQLNPELRPPLKKAGFLRRDPREVERKKYGLKKARRAPQFSKR